MNDAPRRWSSVVCSFSSTVARICSSFCGIVGAQRIEPLLDRCAKRLQPRLVRLREPTQTIAEALELLGLRTRHAEKLLLRRLRLAGERGAELLARILRRRRLLGA